MFSRLFQLSLMCCCMVNLLSAAMNQNGIQSKILAGHTNGACSVAIEGNYVITGSWDTTARVWDRNTGACLHILKGHEGGVISVAMKGNYIVTGSGDNTARVWDRNTGTCLHIFKGHGRGIFSVAIEGNHIVTGSYDNQVRIWDRTTGNCLHILKGHGSGVCSVIIERNYVVTCFDDRIARIWNLTSPQEREFAFASALHNRCGSNSPARILDQSLVREIVRLVGRDSLNDACLYILKGHEGYFLSVAIEGNYVVTGSVDKTARVWDLNTCACLHVLKGHGNWVASVAIKGNHVVTGSFDETARIWDRSTGACLHILEGHKFGVNSVAIDGNHVVTGSRDCTARIWDLTLPQERVAAFASVLHNRCGANAPARILDQNLVRAIGKLVMQDALARPDTHS